MKLVKGQKYQVDCLVFLKWIGPGPYDGYSVAYYFDPDGTYLGPDQYGVEPIFLDL